MANAGTPTRIGQLLPQEQQGAADFGSGYIPVAHATEVQVMRRLQVSLHKKPGSMTCICRRRIPIERGTAGRRVGLLTGAEIGNSEKPPDLNNTGGRGEGTVP